MRKPRAGVVLAAAAGALIVLSTSCLDPTEITLEVTTDVRCEDAKGTVFQGGASPRETESAPPSTVTAQCANGDIGTLVATPSNGKDSAASFLVTMGVDRPVTECTVANGFKGCIVQRRAIRYVKHKPLVLPIRMWLVCKDVACDADSTCARNGKCVPSAIQDPERCASGPCFPEGDGPDVPPADAGGDASDAGDASDGATITDGAVKDADADAPFLVPPPPPGGQLYCPPEPNGCMHGGTCCWKNGSGGRCTPPCNVGEVPLQCNRKADCDVVGQVCCASVLIQQGGVVMFAPPHGSNATDGAPPPPGRSVQSSMCGTYPGPLCSAVLCLTAADCPPLLPTCDKDTTLFDPPGIFGECVSP